MSGNLRDYLFYEEPGITLYCGDCREVLPLLEPQSVDLVMTDPPYGVGIASWDDDIPPQEILSWCLTLSRGPCLWFGAAPPRRLLAFARYDPIPDRCVVWHATFSLASTAAHGMFYRWHPIWIWANGGKIAIERDVIEEPCDGHNGWFHPGTKPLVLLKRLIGSIEGEIILDPFLGSGTTLRAAKDLNRRAIGIEIEPKYCEIAVKRLRQEVLPLL